MISIFLAISLIKMIVIITLLFGKNVTDRTKRPTILYINNKKEKYIP